MNVSPIRLGALVLCVSVAAHAAATETVSADAAAGKFVDALQRQHFEDAAAMFVPDRARDSMATERMLKKVDESVGGLSTMHPIQTLPAGKSIKVNISGQETGAPKTLKSIRFCYASTASDGQPVFYEVHLTADNTVPRVLSFGVHFLASDEQSARRAHELAGRIIR